jgi:hypothetical protein
MSKRLLDAIRFDEECSHDHIDDLESYLWLLTVEYLTQAAQYHALSDEVKAYLDHFNSSNVRDISGCRAMIALMMGSEEAERYFLSFSPLFNQLFHALSVIVAHRTNLKQQREWKVEDILSTYRTFLKVGFDFINDEKSKKTFAQDWKSWFVAEMARETGKNSV